ncbi:hypothetical protein K461DRAFT_294997 [Myriangium duriaei CBS 260.36]|uniref:Uncharacterized protein n=1 Tax=Myriangium duriaei CBS 260.36 TaxID=1168546 RepID=A0A9P4MFA9_9PEZI|nr:hypothetical protein K461DRAFT_294997 [Myriangium duriaei CBS 260.36]
MVLVLFRVILFCLVLSSLAGFSAGLRISERLSDVSANTSISGHLFAGSRFIGNFRTCNLKTRIQWPPHPPGLRFLRDDQANGHKFPRHQSIDRWYVAQLVDHQPRIRKISATQWYQQQSDLETVSTQNSIPSIDHAYERWWLKSFFERVIMRPEKCVPLNRLFFEYGPYLQDIFNGVAGPATQAELVGMSQYVNSFFKAEVMGPRHEFTFQRFMSATYAIDRNSKWQGSNERFTIPEKLDRKLGYLERIISGCQVMKIKSMIPYMQITNQRIYGLLRNMDQKLGSKIRRANVGFSAFAPLYKAYMEQLACEKMAVIGHVYRLADQVSRDLRTAGNLRGADTAALSRWRCILERHKEVIARPQSWRFAIDWDWDHRHSRSHVWYDEEMTNVTACIIVA